HQPELPASAETIAAPVTCAPAQARIAVARSVTIGNTVVAVGRIAVTNAAVGAKSSVSSVAAISIAAPASIPAAPAAVMMVVAMIHQLDGCRTVRTRLQNGR